MKTDNDVLNAFAHLDIGEEFPTLETIESLEGFVVELYTSSNRPKIIISLADLHWHLFSKYQTEVEKSPPTFGALKNNIYFVLVLL